MPTTDFFTTANDGRVFRTSQATWDAAINTAAGTSVNTTQNLDTKSTYNLTTYGNFRSFYYFNTSSLSGAAAIDSATLMLSCGFVSASYVPTKLVLLAGTQADPLTVADYSMHGAVELASNRPLFDPTTLGASAVFELNAAGLSFISMMGVTKFCVMTEMDFTNTAPTGNFSYGGSIGSFENTTPMYRPQFIVNYTEGGSFTDIGHTLDAAIFATSDIAQTLDAVVVEVGVSRTTSLGLDAALTRRRTRNIVMDAIVATRQTSAHTLDAAVKDMVEKTHDLDACLVWEKNWVTTGGRVSAAVPNVKGMAGILSGGNATIAWLPLSANDHVVGVVVQHSNEVDFVDDFSMLVDGRNVLIGANIHEVPAAQGLLWRAIAYTLGRDANEVRKA